MGSYLSSANTDKDVHHEDSPFLPYAVCNMQGWRRNQEDAHISSPNFDEKNSMSLFAVFDGHGGAEVAIFCERHFGNILKHQPAYKSGNYALALRNAFLATDVALRESFDEISQIHDEFEISQTKINDKHQEKVRRLQKEEEAIQAAVAKVVASSSGKNKKATAITESSSSTSSSTPSSTPSSTSTSTSTSSSSSVSPTGDGKKSDNIDHMEDEFDPNVAGVDVGNGLIVARGLLSQLEQQAAADAKDSNDDQNVEYVDVAGYKLPRILVNQLYSAFIGEEDLEEEEDVDVHGGSQAVAVTDEMEEGEKDKQADFDSSIVISDDDDDRPSYASGCTAVVILVDRIHHTVYAANCGDSRVVLCRDGIAVPLSEDHTPEDDVEVKRIENAGGHVTEEGRINGCLNLSRALGDLRYKTNTSLKEDEQIISGTPDVMKCVLNPALDEYLILMCDGITGSFENQEVVDKVRSSINNKQLDVLIKNYKKSNKHQLSDTSFNGDANTVAKNLNVPVPVITGSMLEQVCGDVCDYCVAGSVDENEDGSGCDNETFMLVRLTDMFTEIQKKGAAETTAAKYNPSFVELPPLVFKRSLEENDGNDQKNDEPSSKKRKMTHSN
jgi:protein phosphatase 1G